MKNLIKRSVIICITLISSSLYSQTFTGSWISEGPFGSAAGGTDYQGRIISFAENPSSNNIIYFGGESGGLWKRNETGNFAELLNTDALDRIGIAEIAVDPTSGTTNEDILIGTGNAYAIHLGFESERRFTSSGIYRTTDGGTNWTQVLSWQSIMNPSSPGSVTDKENTVQIAKIMYNRDDPSKVLAAVRKAEGSNPNNWGRLYRSTNYGATWTEVSSSNISDKFFFDMEVSPSDANTVYLSSHRLYKSTDFGSTWTDVTSNLTGLNINSTSEVSFIVLETAPVGSSSTYDNWVAIATVNESAGVNELFISTDALSSSIDNKTVSDPIPLKRYNHAFEVGYNFNKIWFGGSTEKIRYTASLTEPITLSGYSAIHADIKELFVPKYSGSNQYTIYAGTDGGAYKSTASTPSFSFINNDVSVLQFYSVASSETDSRIIGGTQDNSSMVFRGNAWYYTTVGGDGSDSEIDPSNSDYMFYDDYLNEKFHASASAGVTAKSSDIEDDGGNLVVPIEISTFDNSRIYVGDDVLKYYEHNYETPSSSLPSGFTSLTDITHQNSTINYVLAIGLSEEDPDKIYIATQGYYTEIYGGSPCIVDRDDLLTGCEASLSWNDPTAYVSYNVFKSTNGGTTWTDVSPAADLPGVTGEITGIAVNPNDDDEVWITYNGFERIVTGATLKNKNVFKTTNGGIDWDEDFDGSSNLPICYTNKVVCQRNTNHRVFIATDKGVFWKEDGINWQPFSTGLPNCPITDLSIDDCEGNIYASSYGRGIWKSDLPINHYDDIHITTNTTWNTDDYLDKNVVVEANAILTINGGVTIEIAGGRKITVERGARLEIDDATLTNSCEALWEGIEVWGYDDLNHPPLSDVLSGAYPASVDDHGVVFINGNSLIENSNNGISTSKYNEIGWSDPDYHGGIIVALGSNFRNNRRSAEFLSYGYENVSEFSSCTFITDDLLYEDALPFAHVSMWDVTGVLFRNNVFENTIPLATKKGYKRGKGIYSEEATYDVLASCITPIEPCGCEAWSGNTFNGLYRGIEARSIGVDFTYPLTIDRNLFIDNERAILISSIGNIEMINNDIQVPDFASTTCYGLYLEGSINYHVENNFFTTSGSITDDTDPNSGLFVANNGSTGTTIYRNHFEDMEIGMRCQNTNSGLQIRCNDFTTDMSKYNIVVSSGSIPHQGSCIIQPGKNIFTHDCGISHADFRLASGVSGFNYHYETGEDPICYSSGINLIECEDPYECLSLIPDPCDEEEESQMMMMQSEEEIKELLASDYAKIDGGNTDGLLEDIFEGYVSKEQLDIIGPYLSDAVLEALIETTTELSTSDLLDILDDNSPLNESVGESLEAAAITNEFVIAEMTESSIMTEKGPLTIYSPMQELIAEIEYLENERAMVIQNEVNLYLKNYNLESAISILSNENKDWAKQKLTALYFNIEDYEAAIASLDNITSTEPSVNDFKELMTIIIDIKSGGRNYADLSPEEESTLRALNSKESSAGIAAGNILRFAYAEDYPEVIDTLLDEFDLKSESISIQTNSAKFKLFPNPASEIVYIELINGLSECNGLVNIYDVTGRLVSTHLLDSEKTTSWIELSGLESGIYLFEMTCNDISIGTEKLIIE